MAITPLRVLLFVLGGLIGGTSAAYFSGVFEPATQRYADAPPAVSQDVAEARQEEAGTSTTPSGDAAAPTVAEAAPEDAGSSGDGQDVIVPAFDLLRAEPNGSLVVAGRAAPDAEVEVLSGSTVLARARVEPSGDFAAVLDEALKPGEHNIVLRATSPDNVVATSKETAIVSIPSTGSNEVVALVQQPGEPSRLISVPEPEAPAPPGGDQEDGTDVAGEAPAMPADAPAEAGATEGPSRPPANEAGGDGRENAEQAGEPAGQAGPSPQPAEERGTQERAGRPASEQDGESEVLAEPAAPTASEHQNEERDIVARADLDAAEAQSQEAQSEQKNLPFIEAVEIDGREVFVAGRAEPGRRLRVYANDTLLGQTTVSPEGRFLIEAERDLPVGDYIVRADVLADDGVTVVARAAVPFERHTGEKIAAVASEAEERGEGSATSQNGGRQPAGERQGRATQARPGAAPGGRTEATPGTQQAAAAGTDEQQFPSAAAGGASGDHVPEVVSPRLEPVEGAVIIRRGDTLWQISRRVYGRGVRYTTIYLANQDQIRNPDRIWPGQIFTLPEETDEGVKADFEAIGDQALTPGEAARARND